MADRVFISSTSKDLVDYRNAAIEVCNRLQLVPIAMEYFGAMGMDAQEGSIAKVDDADVYVGIFAHRYGYIPKDAENSVTEMEFDRAQERHLEQLCFLVDPTYLWPPENIEFGSSHDKLEKFKARINSTLIRDTFTTVDNLKTKLMQALIDWKQRHSPGATEDKRPVAAPASAPLVTAPPTPQLLIGREGDLAALKTRLGVGGLAAHRPLTIIRGWPGVGKTTLISAFANDPEVITAFPGGVLWATAGETPNPFQELVKWGTALGAEMAAVKTLEEAMTKLRTLLHDARSLLIVDDVWDTDAALPFKVGGANCVTLFTTRFGNVAREIAVQPTEDIYVLGILTTEQGIELLAQLSPAIAGAYQQECRQLVTDLEGLPLALRVAARLLDAELSSGLDVHETFTQLRESSALLQAKAPDDRFDPQTGTTPTVQILLKKSTDRLDHDSRDYFAFLGAFAPKPATFDLDAMKSVWMIEDPKPTVRILVDRGLLELRPADGRYWMHAVLVKHAQSLLEES